MTANAIARNLFYQVDQDRQKFVLFNAVIDSRNDAHRSRRGNILSIGTIKTRG